MRLLAVWVSCFICADVAVVVAPMLLMLAVVMETKLVSFLCLNAFCVLFHARKDLLFSYTKYTYIAAKRKSGPES